MQHKDAPGETRTPNLLIRSQSQAGYSGLRKAALEWEGATGSPTEQQETPTDSHNNSHNKPKKSVGLTLLAFVLCMGGCFLGGA